MGNFGLLFGRVRTFLWKTDQLWEDLSLFIGNRFMEGLREALTFFLEKFVPFYGEQINCGRIGPFLWEEINCGKLALFMVRFKYYIGRRADPWSRGGGSKVG